MHIVFLFSLGDWHMILTRGFSAVAPCRPDTLPPTVRSDRIEYSSALAVIPSVFDTPCASYMSSEVLQIGRASCRERVSFVV